MQSISAAEAKTHFRSLLLKAQSAPVRINRNGKPVAVLLSIDNYEALEELKLQFIQARAESAVAQSEQGKLIEGKALFDELRKKFK